MIFLGNPPTGIHGHMGIVQFLVNLEEFDEIWILPVYIHQFSSKKLIDFYHRIKMCQLCMEKLGNRNTKVYVSSIEKEVNEVCGGNHGTIDTITYILNCNNDIKIDLIIGEDAYQDICNGKWKHGQRSMIRFSFAHLSLIDYLRYVTSE